VDAELKHGPSGTFEVAVDQKVVARRGFTGFPTEAEIVDAVREALAAA
jgi:selenoprotein W-related protein